MNMDLEEMIARAQWKARCRYFGEPETDWLPEAEYRLDQARAVLSCLEENGMVVVPHDRHRWNIEVDGDDLLVCRGDHEKHDRCSFQRYAPKQG
jgi:hypothetical protein